jgi:hypothetical protein
MDVSRERGFFRVIEPEGRTGIRPAVVGPRRRSARFKTTAPYVWNVGTPGLRDNVVVADDNLPRLS